MQHSFFKVTSIIIKRFKSFRFKSFQRYLRPALHNIAYLPRKIVQGKGIHAYWSTIEVNFGDAITPVLLSSYGMTPIFATPRRAQLVSTGSILHHLPDDYAGYILGSGLIAENFARPLAHATILGLRGKLSRELMQAPADIVLGDPGLLLPKVLQAIPKKKYLLGIVPHFVDKLDPRLKILLARYPTQIRVIDVQRHPVAVLKDIAQCEYIISSSLHGLVIADGLGIPNGWLVLSNKVKGGEFKFRDYYTAFDTTYEPISIDGNEVLAQIIDLTHTPSPKIAYIQANLDAAFQGLPRLLTS
jgi:pyruvyltransferase